MQESPNHLKPSVSSSRERKALAFRRYDERFLELSWRWLNDPEIKRLTMTPDFTREDQARWFSRLAGLDGYLIWGVECGGTPIGVVGLKNITTNSGEYWGFIGERSFWGFGFGRKMIDFVVKTALRRGLESIHIRVRPDNTRAVLLYERAGFVCASEQDGFRRMVKDLF